MITKYTLLRLYNLLKNELIYKLILSVETKSNVLPLHFLPSKANFYAKSFQYPQ